MSGFLGQKCLLLWEIGHYPGVHDFKISLNFEVRRAKGKVYVSV